MQRAEVEATVVTLQNLTDSEVEPSHSDYTTKHSIFHYLSMHSLLSKNSVRSPKVQYAYKPLFSVGRLSGR